MRIIDADTIPYEEYHTVTSVDPWEFESQMGTTKAAIDQIPTIDPESLRPKGTWGGEADGYADGELVYDVWYCSECNYCIDDGTDDPTILPNYCPNCGARMKG